MITDEDIKRINELYHKSKSEGLTEAEKDEQQTLRKAYIEAMRSHVRDHLDNVIIQRPDGSREKLARKNMINYSIRIITIEDYDAIYDLWNATEQSRRALNPVDDSREGIERYLKRNPNTCFAAVSDGRIVGVILTGHDGRRAIVHHMCVHPDYRRMGIAGSLVSKAEAALKQEGIQKIFGLVFKDNDPANAFWEKQGYSLRTNLNYRNKSLNADIPTGE